MGTRDAESRAGRQGSIAARTARAQWGRARETEPGLGRIDGSASRASHRLGLVRHVWMLFGSALKPRALTVARSTRRLNSAKPPANPMGDAGRGVLTSPLEPFRFRPLE